MTNNKTNIQTEDKVNTDKLKPWEIEQNEYIRKVKNGEIKGATYIGNKDKGEV